MAIEYMEAGVSLEEMQAELLKQIKEGKTDEATLKVFDSVNKALAEERKAVNESNRIDAELEKAQIDADIQAQRSKRELTGNAIRGGCQVGAAVLAGTASLVGITIIRNDELADRLFRSGAMSLIIKPFIK